VSEAGAVIHVVGAQELTGQLLEEVIFLVGTLGRGQHSDGIGTVPVFYLQKPAGYQVKGFLPSGFPEAAVFPDKGFREPIGVMDEGMGIPAFDAKAPFADGVLLGRQYPDDFAIKHLEVKATSCSAVRADGVNVAIIHRNLPGKAR